MIIYFLNIKCVTLIISNKFLKTIIWIVILLFLLRTLILLIIQLKYTFTNLIIRFLSISYFRYCIKICKSRIVCKLFFFFFISVNIIKYKLTWINHIFIFPFPYHFILRFKLPMLIFILKSILFHKKLDVKKFYYYTFIFGVSKYQNIT